MVNKQKGQLFSPANLSAHAYLRLKWKATATLSFLSQKTVKDPQTVLYICCSLWRNAFLLQSSLIIHKMCVCVHRGSVKDVEILFVSRLHLLFAAISLSSDAPASSSRFITLH